VLGIHPQLGRNRSENLTGAVFIVVMDGIVGYVDYGNAKHDMVTIVMT
jgi:hypothetical protein